jgi:HAD superfamily hydrolase (TIGR01509 family)
MVIEILTREPAKLHPGSKELLALLHSSGIKNILATSATKQTAVLLAKELMSSFDATVFAEDVGRGKPDPEIFLPAAGRLGAVPADCVVFEDAKSGVQAAKSGGFFCIARDGGLGQDLAAADLVVKSFEPTELLRYFQ